MHNLLTSALSEGRSHQCPLPFIFLPHVCCTSPDQRGSRSSCDQPPCPPVHAAPALPLWVTTPDPPAKESTGRAECNGVRSQAQGACSLFWESLVLEMEAAGLHCQGVPQPLSLRGLPPPSPPCVQCYCLCPPSRPHSLRSLHGSASVDRPLGS